MTVFDPAVVNANAQVAQRPNVQNAVQERLEFDPGDAITIPPRTESTADTQGKSKVGPPNGAKVFKGQQLLFHLTCEDLDRVRPVGGNNWVQIARTSNYHVTLTAENATFSTGTITNNGRSASFPLVARGSAVLSGVGVKVDEDWNGATDNPVKITIKIKDLGPVKPPPPGAIGTIIDAVELSQVLQWQAATQWPDSMTAHHRNSGNLGDELTVSNQSLSLVVWYTFGILDPPAYSGVTVLETFKPMTSNFNKQWLIPLVLMQQPNWTNEQWSDLFFNQNTQGTTSSFTISPTHFICDNYGGSGATPELKKFLTADRQTKEFQLTLPQEYWCPPAPLRMTPLSTCKIIRKFKFDPPITKISRTAP